MISMIGEWSGRGFHAQFAAETARAGIAPSPCLFAKILPESGRMD